MATKKLKSIFTDDMEHCMFTGSPYIERHHVFGGTANRKKCEKYGFIAPLRRDLHPNGASFEPTEENKKIDRYLKAECQKWFEQNIGTREQFREEFGKSWL
jgi:hypothetical protein